MRKLLDAWLACSNVWWSTALVLCAIVVTPFRVPWLQADETAGGDRTIRDSSGLIWRSQRSCGVNCLYVLLQTEDIPVEYVELQRTLLDDDVVPSLTDLKTAATMYGLQCALGRATPESLKTLDFPLIGYWEMEEPSAAIKGHFVLVLGATNDRVKYMDGTTGVIRDVSWSRFNQMWTGHILYRPRPVDSLFGPMPSAAYLIVGAVLAMVVDGFIRRRRRRIVWSQTNRDGARTSLSWSP